MLHVILLGDVFFNNSEVKMLVKWTKIIQNRDRVILSTVPRLDSCICPYTALKQVFDLYSPGDMDPLFQRQTAKGYQVMTDSRVRKVLATLNQAMGLSRNFYTFHCFRHSGATLAYKNRVSVDDS